MANFQQEMERTMAGLPKGTRLLLHACCGPCATTALERLAGHFAVTLYYFNPNTAPKAEYQRRLEALRTLVRQAPAAYPVTLLEGDYTPESFTTAVEARGLAALPEGGARCAFCFDMRLAATAQKARELGIGWFGTTLSTGPRKNAAQLNQSGAKIAEQHGLSFLPADFKKQGGTQRSIQLSAQYGLYRQHYCGCSYSL